MSASPTPERRGTPADPWVPELPPRSTNERGEPRRIGVEIELIGVEIEELARLVARQQGGRVEARTAHVMEVHGDPAGPWTVELDFELLKRLEREAPSSPEGLLEHLGQAARELLAAGAGAFVPLEVTSPPLELARLAEVEALIACLRAEGALGTRAHIAYAFGLQLNPELPALDAATITRYLAAFLCLEDWLLAQSEVDGTRELTRFASRFPRDYAQKVVDPEYHPTLAALIDDYLADNPTRNRTLDCLPLFLHLDQARVRAVVEDPRVKPRPTFHYRLPNSEVDDPSWGVHVAWSDWLEVERLAAEGERLDALRARYSEHLSGFVRRHGGDWAEEVGQWLADPDAR